MTVAQREEIRAWMAIPENIGRYIGRYSRPRRCRWTCSIHLAIRRPLRGGLK
jgi:hypothetical protein